MTKLSIVLAVKNEEKNLPACLEAVKEIADEIVIVDEFSQDKTVEIAKRYGARVFQRKVKRNFHENKQFAIEKATGDWILQLDADEIITPKLVGEIEEVINLTTPEVKRRRLKDLKKWRLFERHEAVVEKRDGTIGRKTGNIVAFFVPRRNMFLGKPLIHAGVYPDAVIRLFKRGKAYLPARSVHEQMKVDGEVAWLFNDLLHNESPTLRRYLARANRYTTLTAQDFTREKLPKNVFYLFFYSIVKPFGIFLNLFLRHKGFLDGIRGFLWSAFSALHFPLAYWKYIMKTDETAR